MLLLLLVLLHLLTTDEVADFISHLFGLPGHLVLPEELPAGISGGSLTAVNVILKVQFDYLHFLVTEIHPLTRGPTGGILPEAFHEFVPLRRLPCGLCLWVVPLLCLFGMGHHHCHCFPHVFVASLGALLFNDIKYKLYLQLSTSMPPPRVGEVGRVCGLRKGLQ